MLNLALNLMRRVRAMMTFSSNGLLLEDNTSFILLEDNVHVLELE